MASNYDPMASNYDPMASTFKLTGFDKLALKEFAPPVINPDVIRTTSN